MPRKRTPRPLSTAPHAQVDVLQVPQAKLPPVTQEWLQATGQALSVSLDGLDALEQLVLRADGRYSVNRASDGAIYHKWAWSKGELAGRYVMYRRELPESPHKGLSALIDKVYRAEAGEIKAAVDPYWKGRR